MSPPPAWWRRAGGPTWPPVPCTVPLCPGICSAVTDRWPDAGTCHCHGASGVQTAGAARVPSQGHVPPWRGRRWRLCPQAGGVGIRRGEHPRHSPTTAHPEPRAGPAMQTEPPCLLRGHTDPWPQQPPMLPIPLPSGDHNSCLSGPQQGDLLVPVFLHGLPAQAATPSLPAQHLIPKSPLCPGLHCLSLPGHVPSPCPKTPLLHNRLEAGTAQPQNKPTSDHPSNRGVTCWSYWDRSYKQLVPS